MERIISERVVAWIIALNFAVIVALGFPSLSADTQILLLSIDLCCLAFFVIEVYLKVRTQGWAAYWSSTLNRMDFVVVILSLPSFALPMLDFNFVVLRAVRFLRLLRAMRFIPNAEHLWIGVTRALKASIGLVCILSLYALVLGTVACQLFGVAAPQLFGDPMSATYTMFQVFTLEGWNEVPVAVIKGMPEGTLSVAGVRLFFVLTVLTGGVLGLSLTNAVFVDEMLMDNNDPMERKLDEMSAQLNYLRSEMNQLMTLVAEGQRAHENESYNPPADAQIPDETPKKSPLKPPPLKP